MSATTSRFIEKPLRLAGVDLASRSQSIRMQSRIQSALETAFAGSAHVTKQLYQMLNDVPARTVFADEDGLQYTMMLTPAGPIMVPWNTGQALTPETGWNDGGFIKSELLDQPPFVSDGSNFHQELQQAALTDLAAHNKSKGIEPLDLAKSLGQSLLQNLAGKGLQELFKGAKLGDLLTQAASTSLSDLATGIGSQLTSMGIDMAFNAFWNVDDESSAVEHVGHTLAGQGLQNVIGSVVSEQLAEGATSLGNIKAILAKYLPAEAQPMLAALRVGDVDLHGNKILEPCSDNVFIEGKPAARVADAVEKSGKQLYLGSATVSINEQIATRIADTVSEAAPFLKGAGKTFIGGKTAGIHPPAKKPQDNSNGKVPPNYQNDIGIETVDDANKQACGEVSMTDQERKDMVEKDKLRAMNFVDAVIDRANAAKYANDPIFNDNFGLDPSTPGYLTQVDTIIRNYEDLRDYIPRMTWEYYVKLESNARIPGGANHLPDWALDGGIQDILPSIPDVDFGPDYFKNGPNGRAETLLHETFHILTGEQDKGYTNNYVPFKQTSEVKPWKRIKNADNYSQFARNTYLLRSDLENTLKARTLDKSSVSTGFHFDKPISLPGEFSINPITGRPTYQ